MRVGETLVGSIAVALQQPRETGKVLVGAISAAAVFKTVGHHRRASAAERPVVARIGPQPGDLRLAGTGLQRRQRRLVGEDALAGPNVMQDTLGERLQMKADPAHPAGHEIAAELDLLTAKDGLLSIERQSIGVFSNSDVGEQRLGRNPGLDQMSRRRLLRNTLMTGGAGIARPARHDHPELRRDHVEAFGYILADLDPLDGAASAAGRIGFDDHFDPREMRRQLLARPWGAWLGWLGDRVELRFDCAEAGLDLFEGELVLIGIEPLRSPPITRPLQRLEQGMQTIDPGFGISFGGPQLRRFRGKGRGFSGQRRRLGARGEHHRLQRLDIVRQHGRTNGHGRN